MLPCLVGAVPFAGRDQRDTEGTRIARRLGPVHRKC